MAEKYLFIGIDPSFSCTALVALITDGKSKNVNIETKKIKSPAVKSKKKGAIVNVAIRSNDIASGVRDFIKENIIENEISPQNIYIELEQPMWSDLSLIKRGYPSRTVSPLLFLNGAIWASIHLFSEVCYHINMTFCKKDLGASHLKKNEHKEWIWNKFSGTKTKITNADLADAFLHAIHIMKIIMV